MTLLLAFALPGRASAANVVPNPGFEQGGCGAGTAVICGWTLVDPLSGTCFGTAPCTSNAMYQDTANVHSGRASMALSWGTDFSYGWGGVVAQTDPASCAPIGPGAHPASFWYGNASGYYYGVSVTLSASFYPQADCTGTASSASLSDSADSLDWKQVTGVMVAPPGTQSALFSVGVSTQCDYAGGCDAMANFDDIDVEDAVLSTPVITSFTPASGLAGTTVDISGINFTGTSQVTFNGAAATFTVASDTEIHATVPAGATTGSISVTTPNGTATSASAFGVPPTISSFTPACGPVGASIDILGTNFAPGATLVGFNGQPASSVTVDSGSELHATIPPYTTGGPISVSTPGGDAWSSSSFTSPCPHPTLASFTPTSGPVGTSVLITGTNLSGTTSVTFNGTAASFSFDSDTQIHATVPAGATTGPISVTTPKGTATSSSSFTVIPPPTVNSLTPTSGAVGTSVSITGTSFAGASRVTFNGAAASYTVSSPTSITATVPNGATTGPISVTTPGGTSASSTSFTVIAPPKVTSFSPTSSRTGQQVIIAGSNFTGATGVELGTTPAKFTVNSSTQLTATVPSVAQGYYRWSVTTPAGTAISSTSFNVRSPATGSAPPQAKVPRIEP